MSSCFGSWGNAIGGPEKYYSQAPRYGIVSNPLEKTSHFVLLLALASQSLSIIFELIPYVRETFRRHLSQKQAVMLVEFDKLKRVSGVPFCFSGRGLG